MNQDDSAILELIKAGDKASFEKLFDKYYVSLCLCAKKITGDLDKAKDIVQDVFVNFYINCQTLEINTAIKSYLYKSVYNACLNHVKQLKTHAVHHEFLKLQLPVSDEQDLIVQAEAEEKIWTAIQQLPQQCRKIFEMNRFEGRKNSEIASILGISIRTVETQISKALKFLRDALKDLIVAILAIIIFE